MKEPLSSNQIGLSIIYAIIILPIAYIIGLVIEWAANTYLFDILDWFNGIKPIWRIFILIAGGGGVITMTAGLINMILGIFVLSFFKRLRANKFIVIWSALIYGSAVLMSIISLLKIWPSSGFWFVIEFILMAFFIIFSFFPIISLPIKGDQTE